MRKDTNDVMAHQLAGQLKAQIKTMVGISVTVDVLPEGSLPRSEGKAQRVFDIRKSA